MCRCVLEVAVRLVGMDGDVQEVGIIYHVWGRIAGTRTFCRYREVLANIWGYYEVMGTY